mgnify:CR=1 FL=1
MTKRNSLVHRPRARASIASNMILNHVMSDNRTVREHATDLHALMLRVNDDDSIVSEIFSEQQRLGISFQFGELVTEDDDVADYTDTVDYNGFMTRIHRHFVFDDRKLGDWLADVPRLKRYISARSLSDLVIAL